MPKVPVVDEREVVGLSPDILGVSNLAVGQT